MRATGITSTLPYPNSLFFWEYDDADRDYVLEEAQFLSRSFGMDIYVMESSPRNYHLISFDVMTLKEVMSVQGWTSNDGDFLDVKMSALFDGFVNRQWNALRISEKGTKPRPKFIALFSNGKRPKALKHFRFYQSYTKIPDPEQNKRHLYYPIGKLQFTVYNTGIGTKPKPFSLGDHLLAQKGK